MRKVRLAVVGAGQMGRRHAELIAANGPSSLVGISDVDGTRRSVAEELQTPFYENAGAMLERESPDGVIIATPNGDHASVAELCAPYSADLLIEKPIADTIDSADRIVRAAERAGVQVLVGHHRRHSPFVAAAREIVRSGEIGRLVAVSMLWALRKPDEYYDVEWRRTPPAGGPTLINLVHEIDSLRFVCGEIGEVYAHASSAARVFEVEDSLSVSIAFHNGAVGSILASDATPSPWSYELTTHENPLYFSADADCYHFMGAEGSLSFPSMEMWRYEDRRGAGWQLPLIKTRREVVRADPLARQLEHFHRVIGREERPIVDGRDGSRSLAVVLAVIESFRSGLPVQVNPDSGHLGRLRFR